MTRNKRAQPSQPGFILAETNDDSDIALVCDLESRCFSTCWSAHEYRCALDRRHIRLFIARQGQDLLGYASFDVKAAPFGTVDLLNIAVNPEARGRGIGSGLLRFSLATVCLEGGECLLEVREGNLPARTLYASCGFTVVGVRPRYYSDTGEDAILYRLDFQPLTRRSAVKKLIAANWKMNKTREEARATAAQLPGKVGALPSDREVVIFAPFTALSACVDGLAAAAGYEVGGQNLYPEKSGAFTGEISAEMLVDSGCRHVLVGHSERRAILGECDEFIGRKVAYALENGLKPMLCIGETLEEREAGKLEEVLSRQVQVALAKVADNVDPQVLSLAYEPVWAIGTGRVAGEEEILEAHLLIRKLLVARFPAQGQKLRVLYGGSVKPENTGQILALDNVDGVLVGGASLEADSLSRIILA